MHYVQPLAWLCNAASDQMSATHPGITVHVVLSQWNCSFLLQRFAMLRMSAGLPIDYNIVYNDQPGVLAFESCRIGHNVARWRLVGKVHPSHLLNASHKLSCTTQPSQHLIFSLPRLCVKQMRLTFKTRRLKKAMYAASSTCKQNCVAANSKLAVCVSVLCVRTACSKRMKT